MRDAPCRACASLNGWESKRKIPTDRYSFEKQETDIRAGDKVCERGEKVGEVVEIDIATRTIDIKKTRKTADIHPKSVFVDARGQQRCLGGCSIPSRNLDQQQWR